VTEPLNLPPGNSIWPRFSLRGLLLGMAAIAALIPLGGVVLRNASNWIGSLAFLIGSLLLAASVCMAFNRTGPKRAFWTGCAVFGVAYFVIAGDPWSQPYTYDLITTTVSEMAYQKFFSAEATQVEAVLEPPGAFPDSSSVEMNGKSPSTSPSGEPPSERDFVMVAHLFWTLLIGFCGGWVSLLTYWTGLPKRGADS
jgi:hypothetical protein